jgi:hypothetical protein
VDLREKKRLEPNVHLWRHPLVRPFAEERWRRWHGRVRQRRAGSAILSAKANTKRVIHVKEWKKKSKANTRIPAIMQCLRDKLLPCIRPVNHTSMTSIDNILVWSFNWDNLILGIEVLYSSPLNKNSMSLFKMPPEQHALTGWHKTRAPDESSSRRYIR